MCLPKKRHLIPLNDSTHYDFYPEFNSDNQILDIGHNDSSKNCYSFPN